MKNCVPVVIFGDHISAYGVIRGLSKYKIPIYIVSQSGKGLAIKSRFVKKNLQINPEDLEFISKLNGWIKKEVGPEAVLIVAGDDNYLDVLSKNLEKLNSGIKTTFPSWEIVQLVREKKQTYKIAEELGIPSPKTYYISNLEKLKKFISLEEGCLRFPLFMKAEDSARLLVEHNVKGVVCNNVDELLINYNKYDSFYGGLLLQELIPGGEGELFTSLISLNKNSEPTGLLINHKKRSSGRFLSGALVASTWSDDVLNYSLKLLKKIGYYGYAGTQFMLDPRDNKFKLMEINGRVSMSNALALKCGVNLPYLMYQEALTGSLPVLKDFRQTYPNNVIWWYLAGDMIAIIRNKEYLKPFNYIKSLIGRGYTIEPFNWRDPCPGFFSITMPFGHMLKKIFRMI